MKILKWLTRVGSGRGGRWLSGVLARAGSCTGPTCGKVEQCVSRCQDLVRRLAGTKGESMTGQNTQATKLLDEVMAGLSTAVDAKLDGGTAGAANLLDAIDRELAGQPRQTAVAKVRQSEVLDQFRRELETQSLTVTTVTSFLQMLQQVLPLLMAK
jgi:hypothetical protein